jgi:tetratricopeptide (TPR) repeat protein
VLKKQIYLLTAAVILLVSLFYFGKTVNPKNEVDVVKTNQNTPVLNFSELITHSKESLSDSQKKLLNKIEAKLQLGTQEDKIHTYNHLANFWKDSAQLYEPYLFYTAEAAKLENSEKSLTFAAQQFINSLLEVADPSIQNWLATNAKVLFDKALILNPNNDSSKVGLGACYILGNISDNPMQGILPVRDIATKNPKNLYAQYILGLGGKKSGQLDKAIERFLIIASNKPDHIESILHLAECYELKSDKANAKIWYLKASALINNEAIKKEIANRINELK